VRRFDARGTLGAQNANYRAGTDVATERTRPARFTAAIRIRAPGALPDALALAADQHMTTTSAYVRLAILERLKTDGIDPAKFAGVAA
jgi:hypothetical protein